MSCFGRSPKSSRSCGSLAIFDPTDSAGTAGTQGIGPDGPSSGSQSGDHQGGGQSSPTKKMPAASSGNDDDTTSTSALQKYKSQKAAVAKARQMGGSLDRAVHSRRGTETDLMAGLGYNRRRSSLQGHDAYMKRTATTFHDWESGQAQLHDESVQVAFAEKDEVDLSVGILEHVLDQCNTLTDSLPDNQQREMKRVVDQLSNVTLLLNKFKADTETAAAIKEARLKEVIARQLMTPGMRQTMSNSEDKQVVEFIRQNVFNPVELGNLRVMRNNSRQDIGSPRDNSARSVRSARSGQEVFQQESKSPMSSPGGSKDTRSKEQKEIDGTMVQDMLNEDAALKKCLANVGDFNAFNVFSLEAATKNGLVVMMTFLFDRLGLMQEFDIPRLEFTNFWVAIQGLYLNNPYHNAVHAADVVQNMFVFLRSESMSKYITSLDVFAGLIAAAVHDVAHPGTNNAFHVATQSDLAVQYNDRSVLENMHIATAFKVLKREDCNFFKNLSADDKQEVRESMIVMVLATDLAVHLQVVSELKISLDAKKESKGWFDSSDRKDRLLLLKTALHCADVANPCKPLEVYSKWVERLTQEWYIQGDMEREAGLPVSALMDRNKPNIPGAQVGFIDFFIQPLYVVWQSVLPEMKFVLDQLAKNRAHYHALVTAAKEESDAAKEDSEDTGKDNE